MIWTRNNDTNRLNYNWARWYPNLGAGRYEVFVYIPANYATTRSAHYWVSHRDGFTLRVVSQLTYSNEWVSLGTYWFQGNSSDYVSLSDVTGESYLSRYIGFDAMKWEPR
jgi:beta-galactosidase